MIATVIINLPEEIQNQLGLQINSIFEKYSRFRVGAKGTTKYNNFPHITITRVDDAQKHIKEITNIVETTAKISPIEIEVTVAGIIEGGGSYHVVLKIKENQNLRDLHKEIFEKLHPYINEAWRKLGGENYCPHLSLITWLPKEKALEVVQKVKIKPFKFIANEIAIKTMSGESKAKILKVFSLK